MNLGSKASPKPWSASRGEQHFSLRPWKREEGSITEVLRSGWENSAVTQAEAGRESMDAFRRASSPVWWKQVTGGLEQETRLHR